MPVDALALALGAAVLHALWNVLLARTRDPQAATAAAFCLAVAIWALASPTCCVASASWLEPVCTCSEALVTWPIRLFSSARACS